MGRTGADGSGPSKIEGRWFRGSGGGRAESGPVKVECVWRSAASGRRSAVCPVRAVTATVALQRVEESLCVWAGGGKHRAATAGRETGAEGGFVGGGKAGAKVGVAKVVASGWTGEHRWAQGTGTQRV